MDPVEYFYNHAPKLIGFLGVRRSGKSEAAIYLTDNFKYTRTRVAQPLKDMLLAAGLTQEEVDGSLKEEPCELLSGKSPRHAMQTLGTEWGRELIGPDFWLNAWLRRVETSKLVVVDDIRFPNEAEALKERGGVLVRITRPGTVVDNHISEQALASLEADFTIANDGTLRQFRDRLDDLVLGRSKRRPIIGTER